MDLAKNNRGITLTSITAKVCLLNRVQSFAKIQTALTL